ncbi:MAG: tetratricopeptide repeat protein, partial [Deltaproteobacteria bacterium]|nr:tetratricopeptide repeat protein [Deltaproteobacteria bacterium]
QTENAQENAQAPEVREREEFPPRKTPPGGHRHAPGARQDGLARKSTLYLTAVLCLLLGVYLGTLLPALRGAGQDGASSAPQSPRQTASPSQRADDGRIRELEEAVGKNPQNLPAWIQLGNQYFDGNKPREAIRAYEHALSIQADNPDVLTDMGIMHRQLGEFEQAAKIFTQASRINPLHEQSRFNLGVVLFFDLNRKDEARKVWRALVGINPEARTPDGALLRTMLDELK